VVNALTFNDQQVVAEGTQTVTVAEVNLSDGGFIAIHRGSASGEVIGNSDYIQPNTQRTNVPITLDSSVSGETTLVAMAHLDTDADETYDFPGDDGPYPGDNFIDDATVTAGEGGGATPTATPTPTQTDDGTATPTATETTTAGDGGDGTATATETDGQGSPGFGITAAVVALIAAALLALRRRD
jgi:PGF-CTERM protein